MTAAQKVFYNTAVQLAGRAVSLLLSLAAVRLTTGYLGLEQFGELAIVVALGELLIVLSDLGARTTLAREVSKAPEEADGLGGSLLRFRVATSLVAVAALLVVTPVLPYSFETKVALSVWLVGVFFTSVATLPLAFFQANLRLEYQAALDVATKLLNLGAIGAAVALDLGFYALVALLVVVQTVVCFATFAVSARFWRINVGVSWSAARPLIRDAVSIGVVSMIGYLHFKGDAILLSLLKPAEDVGIYVVAYRFIDHSFLLPGLFVASVFPILTRALHTAEGNADEIINRTFQVLLLGAVSLVVLLVTLAEPLVHLIATEEFDAAIGTLRLLSLALLPAFVAPVFYNALIAVNRQRALISLGAASVALNVALNLVLIPPYSYNGAAIATVVSETFSVAGTYLVARRQLDFRLRASFLVRVGAATAASVVAGGLLWSRSPWASFLAAELVFVVSVFVFRAVTRADLRLLLARPAS